MSTKPLRTPEELSHNEQLKDVSPVRVLLCIKLSEIVEDYFNEETCKVSLLNKPLSAD